MDFVQPEAETTEPPEEINPLAPIVPPRTVTSLILTPEQEETLRKRIFDRIDTLRTEMGAVEGVEGYEEGWMWERQKNQLQYDNSWEWRKALGGIFTFSNFSLNLSKRYARLMAAKTTDDLVGTDPFFSCMPTEKGDATLAKQAEWYIQERVSQSNAKKNIRGAQKTALIRNECVVKLSWVERRTHFRGQAVVAIGPNSYQTPDGAVVIPPGQPIMTPRGEYIYQKDNLFEDPKVEGLMRLEKEPNVAIRHQLEFKAFEDLDQWLQGEHGLNVQELDYRDFLCPLNAATVHEADINVHLFDEEWERLKALYTGFEVAEPYFGQSYMSGEKRPNEEKAELENSGANQVLKIVNCGDAYIRCNPYDDGTDNAPNNLGMESEVWAVVDITNKKLIWYDYLGNHMSRRPFEVIPGVERVQNRWYGVGVFEMLDHKQLYVDTQFNRVNWKSMKSSSLRFMIKNAVAEWKAGEKIEFGDDTVYTIEDPRFDSQNPPFFEVNPREIDEYAMKLIELMIQAGSTEVGIVGPDDGAMAGLDTTKLATGIKSLERTGNLLMKFTETDHAEAIAAILDQAVDIILEHMDEDELIYREDTDALVALNRDEVRKLYKSIKLLLTRSRSTETIETARMVIQLCREYMEVLNPYEQRKLRPEYLRQLKALETPDADALLDEVTEEQVKQWQADQAKAANLPPKTSVATRYSELARSEQEQILQKEGIVPAGAAELARTKALDDAQEVRKEGAIAEVKEAAKPAPTKPTGKK